MNKILVLCLIGLSLNQILCSQPNPPVWPESVKVFEPNDGTAQSLLDQIFQQQGGHQPSCNGQFSDKRYALLFKPGTHNVQVNVGYYTHVMGLGSNPTETQIQAVRCQNGDFNFQVGALNNFWRAAENFYVKPTDSNAGQNNIMLWAVSQASPLRRIVIDGSLQLFEYDYGDAAGFASGGYIADLTISGNVYSGSQQQFIARNSKFASWIGSVWNYVFVGSNNAPGNKCTDDKQGQGIVNIPSTPVIAEKPFIVFENGRYFLAIPQLQTNKQGTSNYGSDIQKVDFQNVFVAKDTDSADVINSYLAQGLHLVLTPGVYNLQDSIKVTNANTVVLGLGLATLVSAAGKPAIVVSNVDGVRISGILLEAGPQQTSSLLQWGEGSYAGNNANPGFLQDCYARVGGPTDPNRQQVQVDKMIEINSGNVVLDNLWLWRADHGIAGQTQNSQNPVKNGIVVNGDNVIAYSLAVEHTLGDLVQWNGENGQVYFYQSEYPYDVTQANFADQKYVSYRVNNTVNNHKAFGVGIYSYFANSTVTIDTGISVPNKSGIQFTNSLTVFLNGMGGITHVINDQGAPVYGPSFNLQYKCYYQGSATYNDFLSKEQYILTQ